MSAVLVTALRVAFLALLWFFILLAANVVRTDMFGRTVAAGSPELAPPPPQRKRRRSGPTTLVVTEGRSSDTQVDLADGLIIGRARDAGLTIDDDYASTHHARLIQSVGGGWQIEDLTSTNGTYVNDVRLIAPTTVTPKDDIRIGRTHLRLEK